MSDLKFKSVMLSDFTTIKLGGAANMFVECVCDDDILKSLTFAREKKIRFQVLGGGSNSVFSDEGFDGVVLFINSKGIEKSGDTFSVKAGERWDDFVKFAVGLGFSGVECLSGIPGSAGATPIQNVGAYGQEVADVIVCVRAIDTESLKFVEFSKVDCDFSYRSSRFKSADRNRFVITDVSFKLNAAGAAEIKYKELNDFLGTYEGFNLLENGKDKLAAVRDAVIAIRRGKGMVYDECDAESFSCGSFFTNPVLNEKEFDDFIFVCKSLNVEARSFKVGEGYKVSAAWLIEKAGFEKGFTENGVGISSKHTLAIVNRGGTTRELIDFAERIRMSVFEKFKIELVREPVVVV